MAGKLNRNFKPYRYTVAGRPNRLEPNNNVRRGIRCSSFCLTITTNKKLYIFFFIIIISSFIHYYITTNKYLINKFAAPPGRVIEINSLIIIKKIKY